MVSAISSGRSRRRSYANLVVNIFTDAVLTLAPTFLVVRLKTTSEAKLAVITLLSLSSL